MQVPAKLAPIASFYLFHNGTDVASVLAEAKLVNITQVLGQANKSRDDVINKLQQQFTIKYKVWSDPRIGCTGAVWLWVGAVLWCASEGLAGNAAAQVKHKHACRGRAEQDSLAARRPRSGRRLHALYPTYRCLHTPQSTYGLGSMPAAE
jgi:hypothetical protein